jgi:DNA-binding CsgD family transcriptional regulator/PAS domain-containing protein
MNDGEDRDGQYLGVDLPRSTFSRIYIDSGEPAAEPPADDVLFATHGCPDPLSAASCEELLRRDRALAETGQLYQALVDAMFDACYDWDLKACPLASTEPPDGAEAAEASPAEAEARAQHEESQLAWRGRIHRDDRQRIRESVEIAVRERGSYQEEYRLQRLDGSYAVVEDRGLIVCDDDGEPAHIIGAVRDVTRERQYAQSLEERNTALRVLVEQRDADRRELEQKVAANLERLILPAVSRLKKSLGSRPEAAQLDSLRDSILEVMGSFGLLVSGSRAGGASLTRREAEIAQLVKAGKTTAEIAEALYVSPQTVTFHRKNIRRKLGLSHRGEHLTTFFSGAEDDGAVTR